MIDWKELKEETGQSIVEFALILPLLILLLMGPVEYYRFISKKITLNSAASDILVQMRYEDFEEPTFDQTKEKFKYEFKQRLKRSYGDQLNVDHIDIQANNFNNQLGTHGTFDLQEKNKEYMYYVYSSDREQDANKFDQRPSNYTYTTVTVKLSYDAEPLTFVGRSLLGDHFKVETRPYTRSIYKNGFDPSKVTKKQKRSAN